VRRAYLSLGSNVGDRAGHLRSALVVVVAGDEHRVSSVYLTEPWGPVEQDDFFNLVVEVTTDASARELLERCRAAEAAEGRTREVRFGPRTLDADVLLVGDERVSESDLEVPHRRMYERRFVLVPLRELDGDLVTVGQLEAATGEVRRLGTLSALG
jgi:2-amino-4-hydroxy-6-hydroxymethyldihydropteridine diphosphokinase